MGISLTLPLLVLLGFSLAAAGLVCGAIIPPCLGPARRRTAIWFNLVGLLLFVGSLLALSRLVPRHLDDVVSLWEIIAGVLQLAGLFFAVEGVVLLLHWAWSRRQR